MQCSRLANTQTYASWFLEVFLTVLGWQEGNKDPAPIQAIRRCDDSY